MCAYPIVTWGALNKWRAWSIWRVKHKSQAAADVSLYRKGRKRTTTKVLSVRNLLFRLFPWKTKHTRQRVWCKNRGAWCERWVYISNESISEAATASAVCAMRAVNLSCCEFSFFYFMTRVLHKSSISSQMTELYAHIVKCWRKTGMNWTHWTEELAKKWSKTLFAHCKNELEMFLLCTCLFRGSKLLFISIHISKFTIPSVKGIKPLL